jgi:hypothetical protein
VGRVVEGGGDRVVGGAKGGIPTELEGLSEADQKWVSKTIRERSGLAAEKHEEMERTFPPQTGVIT